MRPKTMPNHPKKAPAGDHILEKASQFARYDSEFPSSCCDGDDPSSTSNLTQFLNHTTPKVPLQHLRKTCLYDSSIDIWRTNDSDSAYFILGDLWDSFSEWSAYGAGVPLTLSGSEAVVQYYVPYLSGMQLYTRSNFQTCLHPRKRGEESDGNESSDYRDSSSEASSDNESDECGQRSSSGNSWRNCQNVFCSARKTTGLKGREFSSDEEDAWGQKKGPHLFMEYFEHSTPYCRVPLVDKVKELSRKIPELRTMNSFQLLPMSWFSIAWYPIYRIPTGPTLKDLATCFLTFHGLSTPFQGLSPADHGPARLDLIEGSFRRESVSNSLVLRSFGLASYKLRGAFWTAAATSEKLLASMLETDADAWLKSLKVRHPDFEFFASRRR